MTREKILEQLNFDTGHPKQAEMAGAVADFCLAMHTAARAEEAAASAVVPIVKKQGEAMETASAIVEAATGGTQIQPYTLTLVGGCGIGKTHLAKRARDFFKSCIPARMRQMEARPPTWPKNQPWSGVRMGIRRGGFVNWRVVVAAACDGRFGRVDDLCDDWFVALDDIGAEHQGATKLSASLLERVISARTARCWTLVTSNLTVGQIADQVDPRVASRLVRDGGVVVDCSELPDYAFASA